MDSVDTQKQKKPSLHSATTPSISWINVFDDDTSSAATATRWSIGRTDARTIRALGHNLKHNKPAIKMCKRQVLCKSSCITTGMVKRYPEKCEVRYSKK